jgi:polysaccharide biosynthesis protein PslG
MEPRPQKRLRSAWWWVYLLALEATTLLHATGLLTNFEGPSGTAGWRFDNGPEFPGAKGSLAVTTFSGRKCAELHYDFRPPAQSDVPFNPEYVLASTLISPALAEGALRVRLKMKLSSPTIAARLRVRDSTGQTLQYDLTGTIPLTATTVESWAIATADLSKPEEHWGGKDDGRVQIPATEIAVLVSAPGARNQGWVRFTDVELLGRPESTAIRLDTASWISPVQEPEALADHVGVNMHSLKDDRALDAAEAVGFRWIRMDAEWNEIERQIGRYDFSGFDGLVSAAARRNFHVLAILDYGHAVHTGGGMKPPRSPAAIRAYAAFCEAMSRHFAGRGVAFEIWNEPDVDSFWDGIPNAHEYAEVLRAAIDAVKRGDPTARVLSGGLSAPYDVTYAFWNVLEQRGALAGAGGLGAHLYGTDVPEQRWGDVLLLNEQAARAMPGQKAWCTEWGFSSTKTSLTGDGHSEAARHTQAVKFIRELLVGWWADLPLNILYELKDDGGDAADPEHNFGLLTQDYEKKPALIAVRQLLSVAGNHRLVAMLGGPDIPGDIHAIRLDGPVDKIYVVWLEETAGRARVQLPGRTGWIRDMLGQRISPPDTAANAIDLTSAGGPVYIQVLEDRNDSPGKMVRRPAWKPFDPFGTE